jgi:hypothetical protein
MLDEGGWTGVADADADEVVTDGQGRERRRAFRRKLPFGRGAVLVVGERAHIVGVADVSVTGAYLTTRAPVAVGDLPVLKLLLVSERVELALPAEVVRVAQADHESPDHPRGVAVRFRDLDARDSERLRAFVSREPATRRRN